MTKKPSHPIPTLEQTRAAMESRANIAQAALHQSAREQHSITAEGSHLAALAAERLQSAVVETGSSGCCSIAMDDIRAVLTMLHAAQNAAHVGYLRQLGSEDDYQKIGRKVAARYRTPSGKWRLIQP